MAGDFLYRQRRLHPEWYQSFLRDGRPPPEALPPGKTAINWKADWHVVGRQLRVYEQHHALPPALSAPFRSTLLFRTDERLSQRARRYQNFVDFDRREVAPAAGQPFYIRDNYTMPPFLGMSQS